MENTSKLYIVSFGDSSKYRYIYSAGASDAYSSEGNPLASVEKELHDYLENLFPGRTFAYLVSPRMTEVSWEHRDKYADYPMLDSKAIEEIKQVLAREVRERADLNELNDNAPFSQIASANF